MCPLHVELGHGDVVVGVGLHTMHFNTKPRKAPPKHMHGPRQAGAGTKAVCATLGTASPTADATANRLKATVSVCVAAVVQGPRSAAHLAVSVSPCSFSTTRRGGRVPTKRGS